MLLSQLTLLLALTASAPQAYAVATATEPSTPGDVVLPSADSVLATVRDALLRGRPWQASLPGGADAERQPAALAGRGLPRGHRREPVGRMGRGGPAARGRELGRLALRRSGAGDAGAGGARARSGQYRPRPRACRPSWTRRGVGGSAAAAPGRSAGAGRCPGQRRRDLGARRPAASAGGRLASRPSRRRHRRQHRTGAALRADRQPAGARARALERGRGPRAHRRPGRCGGAVRPPRRPSHRAAAPDPRQRRQRAARGGAARSARGARGRRARRPRSGTRSACWTASSRRSRRRRS